MALIDFGFAVARLTSLDECGLHRMEIFMPHQDDEDGFVPAQSISIGGKAAMIALRDALNEAYPEAK